MVVVFGYGARRAGLLVALAIAGLTSFANEASAQPARGRTTAVVERERTAATRDAERLRREADAARAEVAELNTRLVESGRRRTEAEVALTDAEARLAALQLRAQNEGVRYRASRDSFEAALIAAAFAERQVEPRAARIGVFARAVAPDFNRQRNQSASALAETRQLNAAICDEQRVLAEARDAIDSERASVETLLAQRRAVQTTLASNAQAAERRARQLASEARNLRDLAQRASANRRVASSNSGAATTAGAALPASWLAPAEGAIVSPFGTRIAGGPASQGVQLRTRAGAQVISPARGEVAYAGVFRSYGQVLILNLDGGYALVLTGMANVRARVGETVIAGQPVGEMSGSDTSAPELYVEVRRDGRPVDPARWLSAQGLRAERSGGAG